MSLNQKILDVLDVIGGDVKELYTRTKVGVNSEFSYIPNYEVTLSEETSVITLDYTPGYVRVNVDGFLFQNGVDYIATNGTSISFFQALPIDTFVSIERWQKNGVNNLQSLLVYYGTPVAYKGITTQAEIIQDIVDNYNVWIVGEAFHDPLHADYASTNAIIDGVRAAGVIVYGYINAGVTTSNLSLVQIQTRVDNWDSIGVDGIFLDEFGFDFQSTRQRQIDIVDYIHGKNLRYCASATVVQDFACDNISEVTWDSGDAKYISFTTYNPTNQVLPRNTNDAYLLKNFCYGSTGPKALVDAQYVFAEVKALSSSKDFTVWAHGTLPETSPGVLNKNALGNLDNLTDVGAFISANAFLYDFAVVGASGVSNGSNGSVVTPSIFRLPRTAKQPKDAVVTVYGSYKVSRYFGSVLVEVYNTPTKQLVNLDDHSHPDIPSVVPANTDAVNTYSYDEDSNGIYTRIEMKTSTGVLLRKSVLSGGTSPDYTTRTETHYAMDGVTETKVLVFTLTYVDGVVISEVLQ